jgi:hypothetical protein
LPGRALILVENLSVPFDRRVWQECTALRDAGWEVHVICPKGGAQDTEARAVIDGVKIYRYPLQAASGGPLGYVWEYASALSWTLFLALRLGRVDVVHACNPPDLFFVVAKVLRRRGTRFVFDQHDLVPEAGSALPDGLSARTRHVPGRGCRHRDERELPRRGHRSRCAAE